MKKTQKHPFLIGTLILTLTGFISRIIGFFYRIYLSQLFGEEGMGIYQLLSPVLALSFSFCAAGYQTAISKLVAEYTAKKKHSAFSPMLAGLSLSLPLSLLCCGIVYRYAWPIGSFLLQENRTVPLLRILAFSLPFSAVHSCINGYFYGIKKTGIPAISQLAEQLVRVGCVYLISAYAYQNGREPTISVAVLGLTIGELASMIISVVSILWEIPSPHNLPLKQTHCHIASVKSSLAMLYGGILPMALPLTANRLVLNFLQSIESVSIPARLRMYGYDNTTALSVYGVLTGMAMPLLFFPNAITGSIAVLLLPLISENYAKGDVQAVKEATLRTVKYCFLLGFFCLVLFLLLGKTAGEVLFHSQLAGHFITTLSFICPFIYLDTTLSSILQGLGMAGRIFLANSLCLLLRLAFILCLIPQFGISAYLWGLLASQLLLSFLYILFLHHFLQKKAKQS